MADTTPSCSMWDMACALLLAANELRMQSKVKHGRRQAVRRLL
jgi:hypothetical protein